MCAVISTVLAIQGTSQPLSALNTCNYSLCPPLPSALHPCLSRAPYLAAHIFLWLEHGKKKIYIKKKEWKKVRDIQLTVKCYRKTTQNKEHNQKQ